MNHPNNSLEKELGTLLSESIGSAKKREKNYFDELAGPFKDSLVFFGAGSLGRKALAGLRKEGVEPLAFCDNEPSKWGQYIDGIQVLSTTAAAARYGSKAAFVVTIWNRDSSYAVIKEQLLGLQCSKVIPFPVLAWKYPEILLPHYNIDLPHKFIEQQHSIIQIYNLLSDKESCDQYLAQLRLRLLSEPETLPPPCVRRAIFSRRYHFAIIGRSLYRLRRI